jgi:thiamine transport system substrate-binding protein
MKPIKFAITSGLIFAMLLVVSCAAGTQTASPTLDVTPEGLQPEEETPVVPKLTVMTHDSFLASEEVIQEFEEAHRVDVEFLKSGDAGTALNKAILSKDVPFADAFYGVDNTFLSRALQEGIFEPYQSPILADIPDEFELDPQFRALPVDYGDVCLNYDKAHFAEMGLEPPADLEDLAEPDYKGMLVVENPATSSPGLAFLLATIGHFGEEGYIDFWQALVENDVLAVNDWEIAYYNEFSLSGGTRPIVVSYGSSPPAEVIFAESPIDEAPTAAVVSDGACFRQIEFVGILKGTLNRDLAEAWIDFMLSPTFQEDIPLQMFVYPTNKNAKLDETFQKYVALPENPVSLDPEVIAKNREAWILAWTEAVLR